MSLQLMENAMDIDPQALETWKSLYLLWYAADKRARKARDHATLALMKRAHGRGTPPTADQVARIRRFENDAEWLRIQMDATIFSMVGAARACSAPTSR